MMNSVKKWINGTMLLNALALQQSLGGSKSINLYKAASSGTMFGPFSVEMINDDVPDVLSFKRHQLIHDFLWLTICVNHPNAYYVAKEGTRQVIICATSHVSVMR